jgi:hypothetical protein
MMMRSPSFLIAVASGFIASMPNAAQAQFEPINFQFVVDPATGEAFVNSNVQFAGFQLMSPREDFRPENLPYLDGSAESGVMTIGGTLLGVLVAEPSHIAAASISASVGPGFYDIGSIFPDDLVRRGPAIYSYSAIGIGDDGRGFIISDDFIVWPEPAHATVLGAFAVVLTRRRARSAGA